MQDRNFSAYFELLDRAEQERGQRFSKRKATALFNAIAGLKPELRLDERHDGCFQRTQLTQEIMEQRGLRHGFMHAQFDGRLFDQHIAPYARVQRLGGGIDMVFDFTLQKMAPIEKMKTHWLACGAHEATLVTKPSFFRPSIMETMTFLHDMQINPPQPKPDDFSR